MTATSETDADTMWPEILGHERVVEQLRRAGLRERLAGAYLFVGPPGVGKRTVAMQLARTLLCSQRPPGVFAPCKACSACAQVDALTHPDLEYVHKQDDQSAIPVDVFIGDREHRMREGLCHRISLKPFSASRKVAIIDDADYINIEGANSLLKTLEEPPPDAVIILIATSLQKQLPTIRSRCQVIQFSPLRAEHVARLLRTKNLVEDDQLVEQLATLCEGSLQTALDLADPELLEYRVHFLGALSDWNFDPFPLAKELSRFVDAAGKDAPPRRRRLRQVIAIATSFYRQLARVLVGASPEGDAPMLQAIQRAASSWSHGTSAALACVDACLEADQKVLASAHPTTLIDCWLDELSEAAGGRA